MQQTAYARLAYERQLRKRGGGPVIRRKKTFVGLVKDFLRATVVFLFNQVGVCVLLVLFNVIGAFSFRALEGINGDASVEDMADGAQNSTIKDIWNLTLQLNILEEKLWRSEVSEAVKGYQNTLVPLIRRKNYRGVRPNDTWTLPGSLMYSLTIYTTIGYGNLTPRTDAGKVATIFYALMGMPLMLLYMSNVGEVLAQLFKFLYFRACRCRAKKPTPPTTEIKLVKKEETLKPIQNSANVAPREPKQTSILVLQEQSETEPTETIPIFWCLMVITVYVFCGGMLFSHWEDWTTFDGCYFCYISLSTIGFGDLVPGKVLTDDDGDATDVETIQIVITVYLLMGMALVAMCFNLMQEEALENLRAFWRSLGCLRRKPIILTQNADGKKDRILSKYYGYYARAKENALEMQPIGKLKRHLTNKMPARPENGQPISHS